MEVLKRPILLLEGTIGCSRAPPLFFGRELSGFRIRIFFVDPDPGKIFHADPDPGGIRGRGVVVKGKMKKN